MNKIPWEDISIAPRDEWGGLCRSGGQIADIRSMQLCLFGSLAAQSLSPIVADWFNKEKS